MTQLARRRRLALGAFVGVILAATVGHTARAEAPTPTDYESEIVSIQPPTEGIAFEVIGGDSFIELTVDAGVDVVVAGYEGEPYLWFREDGRVAENQRSPATYLNATRYGTEFPASADPDADPVWRDVASDGSYAWYDHRAHWMLDIRPAGSSPGDQILESVIPLRVDGVEVDVTVISTWQAGPSPWPVALGVLAGLATVAAAIWLAYRHRDWPASLVPLAGIAALVGWWQYLPLPAETGPQATWVLLSTIAFALVVLGAVVWHRQRLAASVLALIAGLLLVAWGVIKRDDIGAAIVPTTAPQWLDVVAVTASLVGGVGVIGLVIIGGILRSAGTERARVTT